MLCVAGCDGGTLDTRLSSSVSPTEDFFVDETTRVGLDFAHSNGMSGKLYFAEIVGAGGALFDADNDGDLDAYLVQGGPLGEPSPGDQLDRLLLNRLPAEGGANVEFSDITERVGLKSAGYGMGAAVGDIDNDGWNDLYVTNLGANQMWRNQGVGDDGLVRFIDGTEETLTGGEDWSISAAFLDYNRDGWLDLYVVNYVRYSVDEDAKCTSPTGLRDYCSPLSYKPEADQLFKNLGLGPKGNIRFEDVSEASGIASVRRNGMGVVSGDFNADGWPDLYVANDLSQNLLWLNQGDGTFIDEALLAGSALNGKGIAEASMGVAVGDVDRNGAEDLFMTHLFGESNTLFLAEAIGLGQAGFVDRSAATGLGFPSVGSTGFGTVLLDYDNDGWSDVFVGNGAVTRAEAGPGDTDSRGLKQRNQLYRHQGASLNNPVRFDDVTQLAGRALEHAEVTRGVVRGDVDNDGDSDLLVLNNNGPAQLLLNQVGHKQHWVGLRLVSGSPIRDHIGAVATLQQGEQRISQRVRTDGSYGSASDPRLLFGLGQDASVLSIEVTWIDRASERWELDELDRYWTLTAGTGQLVER